MTADLTAPSSSQLKHVCMFSAGGGSWRTAKIVARDHGVRDLSLVFVDTLYEDADAYRFLIEGALNVFGRTVAWVPAAEDFPDYRVSLETDLAEYAGNPEWRAFLAELRSRASEVVPELTWLVEGRDPWEVFRDERFLGNSRVDPCSKFLKRAVLDKWRAQNFDPRSAVFYVGIGEHEKHRYDDGKGGGLGPRMAEVGWDYRAPLLGEIEVNPSFLMRLEGLSPPRLYDLGYMHNNCGGFCVKAGHAHFANRYSVQPERFAYDAAMEGKMRAFLGPSAHILTDRRGDGKKKPMTLFQFQDRLDTMADEARAQIAVAYDNDSGCGCMVDVDLRELLA